MPLKKKEGRNDHIRYLSKLEAENPRRSGKSRSERESSRLHPGQEYQSCEIEIWSQLILIGPPERPDITRKKRNPFMSYEFTTTIGDDETSPLYSVEVEFDFVPSEKRTWDHPGIPAEVEIFSVRNAESPFEDFLPGLDDLEAEALKDEAFEYLDRVADDALIAREAARRGIDIFAY